MIDSTIYYAKALTRKSKEIVNKKRFYSGRGGMIV